MGLRDLPARVQRQKASSQALETDADLLQQLVAEIGSQRPRLQKKHPNLKTTEGRPRKYYFSEKSDSAEVAAVESVGVTVTVGKDNAKLGEHSLYPLLSSYLWAGWACTRNASMRNARRTSVGPTATAGSIRIWLAWRDLGADWHQRSGLRQSVFGQTQAVVIRSEAADQPVECP